MTDEELLVRLTQMEEKMGPSPSPEHEPLRFKHYVKMYNFYESRKKNDEQLPSSTQDS